MLNFLSICSASLVLFIQMIPLLTWSDGKLQNIVDQKTGKQTKPLCVGGKWFQFGSFRFWRRKTCDGRRQGGQPEEVNIDNIPSLEGGPKRVPEYDPNYGYEPYWAGGDWVFDKKPNKSHDITDMCGIKCLTVYSEYGKICARNRKYEYKTFNNYCALKKQDCDGSQNWMVLYRGPCYRELGRYIQGKRDRVRNIISSYLFANNDTSKSYAGFPGEMDKKSTF